MKKIDRKLNSMNWCLAIIGSVIITSVLYLVMPSWADDDDATPATQSYSTVNSLAINMETTADYQPLWYGNFSVFCDEDVYPGLIIVSDSLSSTGAVYTLGIDGAAISGVVAEGETVKVSADDTTPDYLGTKLTGGDGLTATELNPGGNETVDIDVNVKAGVLEIDGDDVDIADNGVLDTAINWGTAATQVSAVDMPVDDGTADTEVLYNNAGAFGSEAAFNYNSGTDTLVVVNAEFAVWDITGSTPTAGHVPYVSGRAGDLATMDWKDPATLAANQNIWESLDADNVSPLTAGSTTGTVSFSGSTNINTAISGTTSAAVLTFSLDDIITILQAIFDNGGGEAFSVYYPDLAPGIDAGWGYPTDAPAVGEYIKVKAIAGNVAILEYAAVSGGSTHTILDGTTHTDTVAQDVSRGSIIVGNSTPAWDELVIGTSGYFLGSNGTDATWTQVDHNSIGGLQGGTLAEYYHLTSAQHTEIATFWAGTDITYTEAETLTDGSDADSLHVHTALTQFKAITIETPTATEDITLFYTDAAITITQIAGVSVGTTPSTTYTIRHGTDRSAAGAEVVTSGSTTTSISTGDIVSSFNDATIVADSWVWLETTATSGTVTNVNITLRYTHD